MSVEYDLLIIGNTPAAVRAATLAAQFQARVAWVTQSSPAEHAPEHLIIPALVELGNQRAQTQRSLASPLWKMSETAALGAIQWQRVEEWIAAIAANLDLLRSPAALASLGIDAIAASGEFCRKPAPGFVVDGRFLQARRYLIAPQSCPIIPAIPGLQSLEYTTPATLLRHLPTWKPGCRIVAIAADPNALPLVQALVRLGYRLTLIVPSANWIAGADPEALALVRAQLDLDRIQLWIAAEIVQVKTAAGQVWVQVGNHAIEADALLLAPKQQPQLQTLNLDAFGVKPDVPGPMTNDQLQMTNSLVYLCAGLRAGSYFPHIALSEAQLAVNNALFFGNGKVRDRSLAIALCADPEIAWVGMTEAAARQQYGKNIAVLRRSLNTVPKAQIRSDLTGLCKLIVHRNGTLLGAHWVGSGASEMVGAIALAMQQNLKIDAIAQLILPSPTLAEILTQTAADWQQHPIRHRRWINHLLDRFFAWRRNGTRGR